MVYSRWVQETGTDSGLAGDGTDRPAGFAWRARLPTGRGRSGDQPSNLAMPGVCPRGSLFIAPSQSAPGGPNLFLARAYFFFFVTP